MKNILFIIMLIYGSSNAVSKFTYYWTVKLTGDTVTVTKLKRNYDSILVWANKISDSLNQVVPRANWFTDHSKTFAWMNIDTISGKVRCDTIVADSLGIRIIRMTGLPSGGTGDSCLILKNGVPTIISASSYRVMIGAASTVQLADSCFKKANKLHGVTTGYVSYANTDSTFNEGLLRNTTYGASIYTSANPDYSSMLLSGSNYASLGFQHSSQTRFWINQSSDNILHVGSTDVNGNVYDAPVRITSTGKVGINTDTPDSTFTDSGSFRVSGNAKIGGHLNAATGNFSSKVQGTYFTTNGEDSLVYEDTTFYDSLYDGATYRARALCRIVKIGAQITLYQAYLTGTITSSTYTYIKGIPGKYLPANNINFAVQIYDNGSNTYGIIGLSASPILLKINSDYLTAGVGGLFVSTSITWIK